MRDLFDVIGLLNGDFPFIHENGNEHTYLEAIQKAKNLSGFLSEKGIKPGDSVGICMQNCTEWIIAYLGIAAHGATCVPLNSWWRSDELKYGVEHSELKLLFVDEKRYQYTHGCIDSVSHPQIKVLIRYVLHHILIHHFATNYLMAHMLLHVPLCLDMQLSTRYSSACIYRRYHQV